MWFRIKAIAVQAAASAQAAPVDQAASPVGTITAVEKSVLADFLGEDDEEESKDIIEGIPDNTCQHCIRLVILLFVLINACLMHE